MPTPRAERPLISVAMGIRYQWEDLFLLERSITSILEQTYRNIELLICERESTPAARVRLARFAEEDCRVRLIDGMGTTELSGRLNRCLKAARGDWVARMDDDDYSDPNRLTIQMNYLQEHPRVAFVGCVARLEREGRIIGLRQLPEKPSVRDFYFVQPFLHPTLFFRRKALEQVGMYSEEPRCVGCEDYDLLLRFYEAGMMGENIQKPLFTYTLPPLGCKKRTMAMRWNEAKTRYVRFQALGLLPKTWPYVIKPLAVGLVPERFVERIRNRGKQKDADSGH